MLSTSSLVRPRMRYVHKCFRSKENYVLQRNLHSSVGLMRNGIHAQTTEKILSLKTLNPKVIDAQYAVRGELVMRAEQHAKTLDMQKKNPEKKLLPFDEIVYCNIGNPQALQQKPLTFFRQVLALCHYPVLLNAANTTGLFEKDAIERAKSIVNSTAYSTGAYTHSQGLYSVRRNIAEFIERRDGFPSNPNDIFLFNGASPAVQNVLRLLIRDKKDGVMTPVPQYPLYSASIKLLGGTLVPYYLDEEKNWSLSITELDRAFQKAHNDGVEVRSLVIINPGNPTGQVLDIENMKEVIQFCEKRHIILMADEVYQENVYIKEQKPFHSFKKVLLSSAKYPSFEMFSFHSVSKGFIGELVPSSNGVLSAFDLLLLGVVNVVATWRLLESMRK